ncbi:MAG: helix-turn-helix transcriptional regulator [Lachnospiraceae bacterium]|nr:helix-turn-helix transcriptional regulator [Lachnospiraceae bacterium]
MLGENIRNLRKNRGYSQETLAEQLHVVRQTVSKWEKGISVPDAEMLNRLSELFEIPVGELLGSSIPEQEEKQSADEVAKQLAILNEQLANQAVRRRKIIRRTVVGVFIAIFVIIAVYVACFFMYKTNVRNEQVLTTSNLECTLNGETYQYSITYDQNFQIVYAGGDAWIADHVQTEKYDDANVLMAQIEDYFTDRGGTCTRVDE